MRLIEPPGTADRDNELNLGTKQEQKQQKNHTEKNNYNTLKLCFVRLSVSLEKEGIIKGR